MNQIIQNLKTGETILEKVPAPTVRPGHILIRTRNSLISAGTERMLMNFGKANWIDKARQQPDKVRMAMDKVKTDGLLPTIDAVRSKLDQPLPLGYCNVGTVVQANCSKLMGDSFKIGERVVSNGPHAEYVSIPKNLSAGVPNAVSDDAAAFAVVGAIALQGIRLAGPTLGECFIVTGLGLIGLLAVQLLKAQGCQVLGIDLDPAKCKLAESFGAETVDLSKSEDPITRALSFSRGRGVDGVLITASTKSSEPVHQAAQICRKRGRIVLVGVTGLELSRADFYEKELSFQVSCSYGPGRYDTEYEQKGHDYPIGFVRWTEQRNFEAVLDMMASGALDVLPLISHRFPLAEAIAAYNTISSDSSALGVILEYSQNIESTQTISFESRRSKPSHKCVAAMIGSGNFAKMTMGPALSKTTAHLKYVSAHTNGVAAVHIAKKYGFENATTDLEEIMADAEVNTVFICTSHNSHATLVCKALQAGKNVFVEKPLCLNIDELQKILSADYADYGGSENKTTVPEHPQLMVGFNRRFSPHVQKIKELVAGRGEPLAMHFSCNAGVIPPNVWVHDPEIGGGRIIGEACHFIDLLSYIAGSPVLTVSAMQMGEGVVVREDKMSIVLGFEDGSIGTVNYFGNGNKSYPKEMMEIFSEGRILRLENFRKLYGFGFKTFRKLKTFAMDKGHKAEFQTFINRVCDGGEPLIRMNEMVNVTLASFAAMTSSNEGRAIHLDQEYGALLSKRQA